MPPDIYRGEGGEYLFDTTTGSRTLVSRTSDTSLQDHDSPGVPMSTTGYPIRQISITAVGAVARYAPVNAARQQAAAGEPIAGFAQTDTTYTQQIVLAVSGTSEALAGAAITVLDELQVGAGGTVVPRTTGSSIGRAMASAAQGDEVEVQFLGVPISGGAPAAPLTLAGMQDALDAGSPAERAEFKSSVSGYVPAVGAWYLPDTTIAVDDTYHCWTTDMILAGILLSKLRPTRLVIAAGTYNFPVDKISLEGVTRLVIECPTRAAVFTRAAQSTSPQELFYTPANSTVGFGRIYVHGIKFHGKWNRSADYLTNFGSNPAAMAAAFRLYGIATDEIEFDWCDFDGLRDLPVVVFTAARLQLTHCRTMRCRDFGAVRVRRVVVYACEFMFSQDNGISISRQCAHVSITNCYAFGGLAAYWVAGWNDGVSGYQHGPRSFHVANNISDCCNRGVYADGGAQNFVISGNLLRNNGFVAMCDNPPDTGGAGRFLDTTLAADIASGATSVTLTDATLATVGEYIAIAAGRENLTHVRQITAKAGNVVSFAEPIPEVIGSAVRVYHAEWLEESGTGQGITVTGDTLVAPAIPAMDGVVADNIVHGFRISGIELAYPVRMHVSGNKIRRPMYTGSGSPVYGIRITDGNNISKSTYRTMLMDNIIEMDSVPGRPVLNAKYGINYTTGGTSVHRVHQMVSDRNWISGVLEGREVSAPTNLDGPCEAMWYDARGIGRTAPPTDPVPVPGSLMLMDFGRAITLSAGDRPANNQTVSDQLGLVTGAKLVVTGDGLIEHDTVDRCLKMSATTGYAYLDVGTRFGIGSGARQYLIVFWVRMVTLGPSTTSGDEGNAIMAVSGAGPVRALQWRVNEQQPSPGLMNLSVFQDGQGQNPQPGAIANANAYSIHQFAVSWQVSGGNATIRAFVDGALASTEVRADTSYTEVAGATLKIGCGAGAASAGTGAVRPHMRLYRAYVEDLAASGRDPATVVASDYAFMTPYLYGH